MPASTLTYAAISRNALVKIGVLDDVQSPSAVQVKDCTRLLNEMLTEWEESGDIKLGFYPQTDSADVVAIPRWAERAVTHDLGLQYAADKGITTTEEFRSNQQSAHERMLGKIIGDSSYGFPEMPQGQAKERRSGDRTRAD